MKTPHRSTVSWYGFRRFVCPGLVFAAVAGLQAETWVEIPRSINSAAGVADAVPELIQPLPREGASVLPPQAPLPREIVVKLRKGSQAAAALERSRKDANASGKRLAGEHELRALFERHGVKSTDAVFTRARRDEAGETKRAKAGKETKRDMLFRWGRLQVPEGADPAWMIAELQANPAVEFAEAIQSYRLSDDPPITGLPDGSTDPMMPQQSHHTQVKSQAAWAYLKQQGLPPGGSHDVVVAVIDTGVDYNHQDLVGNIWTNPGEIVGNNIDDDHNGFIDDIHGCSVTFAAASHSGNPMDLHGHGTHVAGIIASTALNQVGGAGVAFGVQIMPIRAAQYSGDLATTDIAEAVLYAVDNGAEVINMSFGGTQYAQIVADALETAVGQAVLVAAAGNDGSAVAQYPGALPYVLGVMSCDAAGQPSWFSNKSGDLLAPGESILSTLPGNSYASWSGTSMAAPVVSGVAALARSQFWQRDTWSARFIMGNLLNSGPVVDAYKTLTQSPSPDLTLLETRVFDGKDIDAGNDGDGRADSGETVHLGLELMNRYGEATGVTATLEARAEGAPLPDPYVTITVPTVSFGNIGSFNSSGNGYLYDSQGLITGVENPFIVEIAGDCPSEHVIEFELSLTYYDGLNPQHPEPYTRISRFRYVVQRGRNLPTVISSNMTLTAEDYWILGGPVLVEPGVTLTIQPGTRVQWGAISTDPYNPGPKTGSMLVRGNLRIEGAQAQPVSLFPSDLIAGQGVGIQVETSGTADMSYANVRRAGLSGFRVVDHCYFDTDNGGAATINAVQIQNTVFHRLRGGGISADSFENCLFDAGWLAPSPRNIYLPHLLEISGCTFLQDNENNHPLSINATETIGLKRFGGIWGHEAIWTGMCDAVARDGNTYVKLPVYDSDHMELAEQTARYFGGHITSIADQAEQDFLMGYINQPTTGNWHPNTQGYHYMVGLADMDSPTDLRWLDGSPLNYTNWDTGFPVIYSRGARTAAVAIRGMRGDYHGFEVWQGTWRNVFFSSFWEYFCWNPGVFILKLPGTWTAAQLNAEITNGNALAFVRPRYNSQIIHNAFLSKYWDPSVNTWMRVNALSGDYSSLNFNYWGTTSTTLIDHLIVDYNDNFSTARVDYSPPPAHGYASTYPFVEQVLINGSPAESVPKLATGRVDFAVTFNRDMDMSVEPSVSFGPAAPYTDFQVTARDGDFQPVASGWLNPRTWQGAAWITPVSGEGYHLLRISGAVAADDPWLVTGYDAGRFRFEVRAMQVEAMTLHPSGLEGAIQLQWQQSEFDLLGGYNLYRATSATGPYQKLNATVIPPGSETYTDRAVSPAVPMYYKFTVLSTDFQESNFSNVAMAAAIDTVAPTIIHVPPTTAPPARGLRLTATASDNLRVTAVTAHYRALGGGGNYTAMALISLTGTQWTGTIPGLAVTQPGVEYYLVATDGMSEAFSGSPVLPHQVAVSNVPTLSSVTPGSGPATGGTGVTLSGMLFEPGITVWFGGEPAGNVVVLNASQLTCVTPTHFPSLVDVKVVNPNTAESTLLNAFRFEESGAIVSIPNSSGNFGSQVEVAVSGSNLTGLRGMGLVVTWDPAVLSAVSARVGTLTAGSALETNLGTAGRAVMSLASADAMSGGGALVLIRFNVLRAPPASSPLAIESMTLNDGALTGTHSDGVFTVNGFFDMSGTVRHFKVGAAVPGVELSLTGAGTFPVVTNASGMFALTQIPSGTYLLTPTKDDSATGISALDASKVLQKAAGLINLTAEETRAADVNRNGSVSVMDAAYILEAAVGRILPPFPGAGKVWDFLPEERAYSLLNSNLTGQDFSAVLIGDVTGDWSAGGSPAPPVVQSGAAAFAMVDDPINTLDRNMARLFVKTLQPAIHGLDLAISFDPMLTLHEVRTGSLGQNHTVAFHSPVAGTARIAAASALPVSGEGIMLQMVFSGPPANLSVTSIRLDESQIAAVPDPALDVFDQDHDGLINTVETDTYHTDPALADSDGDGRNDGEEVTAGTSPTDALSIFAVTSIENLPGGSIRLTWNSIPGRIYTVETTEDPGEPAWTAVMAPISAEGAITSATVVVSPPANRAFYRIAVSSAL